MIDPIEHGGGGGSSSGPSESSELERIQRECESMVCIVEDCRGM